VPVIVPHILSRFPLNESEVRNVAFSCASIKLGRTSTSPDPEDLDDG
jgi:hypothetical protein